MVSHLFYYQLALVVLVWLFVMLHVTESQRGDPISPTATPMVAYLLAADNVSGPLPYRLGRRNQPVIHPPNQFSVPVSAPVSLPLRAPQPLHPTLLNWHPVLAELWLGPRRHPIEQHLFQRPAMVCQARRHRWGTRSPHFC
jgi:hypothetical protein